MALVLQLPCIGMTIFICCFLFRNLISHGSYIGRVPTADVDAYFGIPVERRRVFSLQEIQSGINIEELLQARRKCTTEEFNLALDMREHAHGKVVDISVFCVRQIRH